MYNTLSGNKEINSITHCCYKDITSTLHPFCSLYKKSCNNMAMNIRHNLSWLTWLTSHTALTANKLSPHMADWLRNGFTRLNIWDNASGKGVNP